MPAQMPSGEIRKIYLVCQRGMPGNDRSVFIDGEVAMQSPVRHGGIRIPMVPRAADSSFESPLAYLVPALPCPRVFVDAQQAHELAIKCDAEEIPYVVDPAWVTAQIERERQRG